MRVILGIGNPGKEYAQTRHNCGFLVVDELARRHDLGDWNRRFEAQICLWRSAPGGSPALLVKPQTYVNASGASAQALLAFYQVPPSQMLVVVDDINLPLGTLRLRAGGSAGGHNGLRDIEMRLGSEYPRLRMGVGGPGSQTDQIAHVLGRFRAEEQADATALITKAAACVGIWLEHGMEAAMRCNGPLRPAAPPP